MSRRHSGLVTAAVTLKTLHFHHLNSHVKQRLLTACANAFESVLTVLTLISKHYKSISCLSPVLWSKLIGTLFLTLAPARSGQIGSVSPPQASVSLGSRSDPANFTAEKFSQNLPQHTQDHSITPSHTPSEHSKHRRTFRVSSGTLATFCNPCVTRLCLLNHRNFTFYFSAQVFCSVHPSAVLESSL